MISTSAIEVMKNPYLSLLLHIILIDILCGMTKACKTRSLNSHIGLVGLMKHCLIIVMLVIMGMFAPIFNLDGVYTGMLFFFIVQYLISISESCFKLGIPLPKIFYDKLRDANNKYERVLKDDKIK